MVEEFCNSLMQGVIKLGVITEDNAEIAVKIMREEAKDFFISEKYQSHRESAMLGTLHDGYIMADIITECADRIRKES